MAHGATLPASRAVCADISLEQSTRKNRDWLRPLRGMTRSHVVRAMYVKLFRAMQSLGVSVTPVHFYFPVPRLKELSINHWPGGPGESVVDFDVSAQLARLQDWRQFSSEWEFDRPTAEYDFHINNGFFETVDAEVAYSVVRERKPRIIIEVGAGNTTRLLAKALRKNAEEGVSGELITIDPYPDAIVKAGFPGLTQVVPAPVQQVPVSFFDRLGAGDILFLDSSHVVALGSDVVFEILEILPRLKPGVMVHFHDIFIPAEYPKKFVMDNLCFWGEQYMLQAFLACNRQFRVVWSSSMVQLSHQQMLRGVFPQWQGSYTRMPHELKTFAPTYDGQNVWPCSLWIEKVA